MTAPLTATNGRTRPRARSGLVVVAAVFLVLAATGCERVTALALTCGGNGRTDLFDATQEVGVTVTPDAPPAGGVVELLLRLEGIPVINSQIAGTSAFVFALPPAVASVASATVEPRPNASPTAVAVQPGGFTVTVVNTPSRPGLGLPALVRLHLRLRGDAGGSTVQWRAWSTWDGNGVSGVDPLGCRPVGAPAVLAETTVA